MDATAVERVPDHGGDGSERLTLACLHFGDRPRCNVSAPENCTSNILNPSTRSAITAASANTSTTSGPLRTSAAAELENIVRKQDNCSRRRAMASICASCSRSMRPSKKRFTLASDTVLYSPEHESSTRSCDMLSAYVRATISIDKIPLAMASTMISSTKRYSANEILTLWKRFIQKMPAFCLRALR